ncbi:hypothetical protein QX25_19210 [Stutzerimonas stutzeri]|nr:hypothetical protein QX25_19210 [Stutzerimonas stutzeri]
MQCVIAIEHHVRQIGGTQLLMTGDVAGEVDGRAVLLAQTDLEAGEPDPLEADQPPEEHPEQVSALLRSLLAEL